MKYRLVFRRVSLILTVVCISVLIFLIQTTERDIPYYAPFSKDHLSRLSSVLILKTPGCIIPRFNPFDDSLKSLIKLQKPYDCKGDAVFLTTLPNSTIILNETILNTSYNLSSSDVSCVYSVIHREKEKKGKQWEDQFSIGSSKPLNFGTPLGEEFVKTDCKMGEEKNYTQYIPLVPIKAIRKEAESRSQIKILNKLNVILIGIDSTSKLNFLRHFKKTRAFMKKHLSFFDMKGYTKVGDNTFPNLVPLLTGHFVEHYWNESLRSKFFDDLDLIWKLYSDDGYRTFYAEDSPHTGTFQYLKRGFLNPPTDYYYRTLGLAIYASDLKKKSTKYCLNSQLEFDIIYKYLIDFVKTMEHRPYFSFTMVSTLTHDDLNTAGYADEPTSSLLHDLWSSKAFNTSFVVFFSDHGLRFGKIRETYIGKYEERMPFMYVSFPEWFFNAHPHIKENLSKNQNRLITLFDVHATLYDLLNFTKPSRKLKGLSILEEITPYRTCEMANILPHWCPCQVLLNTIPRNENVSQAAYALLSDINNRLQPYSNSCALLEIEAIKDSKLIQANDKVLRFKKHRNVVIGRHVEYGSKVDDVMHFLITLSTRPGGGLFEGTVQYYTKRNIFNVLGISRINRFGNQSACINIQALKMFCFCKDSFLIKEVIKRV